MSDRIGIPLPDDKVKRPATYGTRNCRAVMLVITFPARRSETRRREEGEEGSFMNYENGDDISQT